MNYAGFWRRVIASVVDSVFLGVVYRILTWFIWPDSWKDNGFFVSVVTIVLTWLYYSIFECSAKQGTLGKIVLGLRVVDLNDQRIPFVRASVRHFGKFISAITLMIGFVMVAFTSKKQGLHDIIARTLVIKS